MTTERAPRAPEHVLEHLNRCLDEALDLLAKRGFAQCAERIQKKRISPTNDIAMDMEHLRHMLGIGSHIPKRDWGHRNYFDAGECDLPSMLRLRELGLVVHSGRANVYYATEAGRAAVGLGEKQYQRKRA